MGDHIGAFVAFDASKRRNAVAIAEPGQAGEVRLLGEIVAATVVLAESAIFRALRRRTG